MENYICPSCSQEQTTATQWQTCSVPYLFNLADREFDPFDATEFDFGQIVAGDHESWACPNCGEDLPVEISKKLFKLL